MTMIKPSVTHHCWRRVAGALLCAGVLTTTVGCNQVVYVHSASLGVDVNISSQSGTAKMALGYDRETFAVVPRVTHPKSEGKPEEVEAMSLVSVSNVDALGLSELIFNHAVATGKAAENTVKDPAALKAMRKAAFGDEGR